MRGTNNMEGGGAGQFRSNIWDPCLLVSQISAMQAIFYTSLGILVFLLDSLTGSSKSLDQIFKYQSLFLKDYGGSKLFVAFMLNSLVCGVGLWFVVRRAKQCLDFSATIHVLHLLFCWAYNHWFPNYFSWWLLQIICVTLTTVLGEYLCLHTEMKAIPLSMGLKMGV